jgi:hypothetical protein
LTNHDTPPFLLPLLGLAEPDDVQGWMEHGGLATIQAALSLSAPALRARLSASMGVTLHAGQRAEIVIESADAAQRLVVEEFPAWLIAGAVTLALAGEQRQATLHLPGRASALHFALLRDVLTEMARLGLVGEQGWTGGVDVIISPSPAPAVLDASTTLYLLLELRSITANR